MSEENKGKQNNEQRQGYFDFEARQNLLGFFSLLLQIDKRINPHLYKKDENNRSPNNPD